MKREAVIIDLDGTLVRCNSFSRYVVRMIPRHPLIGVYALARKLRLISHARAKELIMSVSVTDAEIGGFVDYLERYVRRELLHDLQCYYSAIVLASAAPERYVKELVARLNIPYYVATVVGCAENKGEVKLLNVKALIEMHHLQIGCVITDHSDDLPLLKANRKGRNILVNPSKRTINSLHDAGMEFSCHFRQFKPSQLFLIKDVLQFIISD